jgi:hypothetical protein
MRGILNIIVGIVFMIGGMSGKLVMIGTDSGVGLAVVGGVLLVLGLFRLANSAR